LSGTFINTFIEPRMFDPQPRREATPQDFPLPAGEGRGEGILFRSFPVHNDPVAPSFPGFLSDLTGHRKRRVLLCCLSALLLAAAPPGPAHRVKDINTTPVPPPGIPGSAIVAGNTLYFTVSNQLWKSDGTAAGTQPVEGTGALSSVYFQAVLGGSLYFTATDSGLGNELWRTDGTLGGTGIVRDINPGRANSDIGNVVAFRGELYFAANDGVHGRELWKSDGTKDGTVLAVDLNAGAKGSALASLRASGDRLYFSETSYVPDSLAALYTTDGTVGGTRLLRQFMTENTSSACGAISCSGSPPGDFVSFGGLTYFMASDGVSGLELWRTDGTPLGTALVKDICPGKCSGLAFSDGLANVGFALLQVIDGRLVFFANDGVHGFEPWTSDGTEIGTRLLKDLVPGPADSSYGYGLTAVGTSFFFDAVFGSNSLAMWRSDGTEAGTLPVGSPGGCRDQITPVGDAVFFAAARGSAGCGLWKTDAAGTPASIVSDSVSSPSGLVSFGGALYFTAPGPVGFSLWKTDGTSSGTVVVRVLSRETASSNSVLMGGIDGSLLFFANNGKDFSGLWRSDGTDAGTQPIAPVSFHGGGLLPTVELFAQFRGSLFFSGNDGVHGGELWRTDGTPAGTRLVKDIAIAGGAKFPLVQSSNPCGLTAVGDTLYFVANEGDHGLGLWKTDGTESGTVFIKDVALDCYSGPSVGLTPFNGLVYFSPSSRDGLWRTDGTSSGTVLIRPIGVINLTAANGRLIFSGSGSPEGNGLWASDGTAAGTVLLQPFSGTVGPFARTRDGAFFQASTPDFRAQLWRTDGTSGGTIRLTDFPLSLSLREIVTIGNRAYFVAVDAEHGIELWTSDGTLAGTHIVKDISAGITDSLPGNLRAIGGVLLFTARDPVHGEELWQSDGTEAGTLLVQDISPGPASSSPGNFVEAGSLVFFTASDTDAGAELWSMPLSALASAPRQKPHLVQDLSWRR
jgi:ELWxxDGT repeat protein